MYFIVTRVEIEDCRLVFGHDGDVPDGAAGAVVESVQLPHARQARVAVHAVVHLGVDNIDYRYYRYDCRSPC